MQPDGERTQRYTPQQAAELLGISTEAVRQRIRRGSLRAEKDADGRVYVHLDASEQRTDDARTNEQTLSAGHSDSLQEQITYLRKQLDTANERDREQRRIIAALTSRIPALPSAGESPAAAPTEAAKQQPSEGVQVSWWRRVFGG
jgi:excisionase family DNA binding protein